MRIAKAIKLAGLFLIALEEPEPYDGKPSRTVLRGVGRSNAAYLLDRLLGPGLLESAYEACLLYELRLRKMKIESQKSMPVFYKDVMLDCGYRIDLIVEDQVIVEVKSITAIAPIHEAQLMSYLKLSNCKYGLLINFNVKLLKEGVRRFRI
jgi:GxxExxY protein